MANENQGRENIADSGALSNVGQEEFSFPLLQSEAAHSGIRDTDPMSFLQLQISPSSMGFFQGEPANYIGYSSADSMNSMMNNVTGNQLLMSSILDPMFPGDVFAAENNHVMSFSTLNGRHSYDLNRNVQLGEGLPGFHNNLQPDVNSSSPINIGGELGNVRHGSDEWMMPPAAELDNAKFDGSFLSLGHSGNAGSSGESFASAGSCNVSSLSPHPINQETCHSPFNPIDDEAFGTSCSQNFGVSGTTDCVPVSRDGYGTLPGLTSGFDVRTPNPSSRQLMDGNQFMTEANVRSHHLMVNDMNSRYTESCAKAYQTISSGLVSHGQSRSSGSGCSLTSRLPSQSVNTRSFHQSSVEENQGMNLRSNVAFPFQAATYCPTSGTSSRKDQPDQNSQERIMHVPASESLNVPTIVAGQAVFDGNRSKLLHDSILVGKSSLKRSPSSGADVTPRKIMRQHVDPSGFHLHPSLPSHIQTAPLQNTSGNIFPAIMPFSNNHSSIDALSKIIPAPQQSFVSKSRNTHHISSPTLTNITHPPLHTSSPTLTNVTHPPLDISSPTLTKITHPPLHPSSMSHVQSAHFQNFSAGIPQPFYRPSLMPLMQTPKLDNPMEIRPPDFGASSNSPCSSITYPTKVVSQPSIITSLPSLPNPPPKAVMGKTSAGPVASGKVLSGPSTKTAPTSNRLAYVVQRIIESQSQALAAFEKKSQLLAPSATMTTSSIPHIKRQGREKPEESGYKCMLCKRDLAYAPEGPVSIPDISPEVAVLSCGHTFHDQCLLAITPRDQLADPPCIPCSIGELSA